MAEIPGRARQANFPHGNHGKRVVARMDTPKSGIRSETGTE